MLQFEFFNLDFGQIMAYFQNEIVVGWVLVGSGIIAAAWLLERIVDPIPLLGDLLKYIIHFATYFGFFVGILDMLVGYVVYVTNPAGPYSAYVAALLVITGFSLSMRVISKFPIAFLFAGAAASFGTFTIYGFLSGLTSDPFIGTYVTEILTFKWMLVIWFLLFFLVYGFSSLILKLIELIGKIFSSTPVSIILGLGCIAVGIIALLAPAMLFTIPWPTA